MTTVVNETMVKFGYPATLVRELEHWCALLRPAQATLGALVLVCKDDAKAFPDISAAAFSELALATQQVEGALGAFRPYQKINYLMLMMVDPHVHYHVVPRYREDRAEADPGWPGPPNLAAAADVSAAEMRDALKAVWPDGAP